MCILRTRMNLFLSLSIWPENVFKENCIFIKIMLKPAYAAILGIKIIFVLGIREFGKNSDYRAGSLHV